MYNIVFRADGGSNVGMGHIIRCLSLAEELRKAGQRVYFFSKKSEGIVRIKECGFEVVSLLNKEDEHSEGFYYGDKTELESEKKEIIDHIRDKKINILIVDSYNVTNEYFSEIKEKVDKLVYIDDINAFDYNVDVLINYSISAKEKDYKSSYKNRKLLLGPQYALIRKEFQNFPSREIAEEVSEIMITSGSTDYFSTIQFILEAVLKDDYLKSKKINVIIGKGFKNTESIAQIASNNPKVILHQNISDLSQIMLSSDIAISAGGSTLYELCACGTPALSYIIAENQTDSAQTMSKKGYIECLGWYNELSADEIVKKLKYLSRNYEKRKELSAKMQKLVDGKGAERVAEKILGS